ncbi:MAG: response regulator [ANME-2 cluster archaeon]|nr:MAG: response regulator [ANME-2 cluster archaeon]
MMDAEEKQERKNQQRIPLKGKLLVDVRKDFQCIDISEGGLYLSTGNIFAENSFFDVTIPFRNKKVTIKAQIKHFQPGTGVEIEFVDVSDSQRAIIKEIIESIMFNYKINREDKILLIEDHDMSRKINRITLLEGGFFVIEAKDGLEGIKMLKEHTPALIVLDLHMGNMDGFKVLSMLKASPKWMNIPVLVFSSSITQDTIDKLISGGADEFLLKTETSPAKFIETVKTMLRRNK